MPFDPQKSACQGSPYRIKSRQLGTPRVDDKACRLEILRELKKVYDQDPHGDLQKWELTKLLEIIEGNILHRNARYLEEKGLAEVDWQLGGEFAAQITARGIDFLETGEPSGLAILSPLTIRQEFHVPVGAVAGRDINVQISFSEVLNKLADAVEADQKIPSEEKRSLIDKLKSLGQNEWVRSIGTSVLADVIKKSAGI